MNEHKDKLTDADRQPLTAAIEKCRAAAKGDDVSAIKSAVNELEQASQAFSKMAYESAAKAQAGGQSPPDGNGSGAKDEAIDAEFEVKND
jgi:molecular chaperone DnaK